MSSEFTVTFWGTRGSIATPGFRFNCYGGNTTCVEMMAGDTRLIFDAGTGIRDLGNKLLSQAQQRAHFSIFFSHTHWDHIQGFPFFTPAYIPNFQIDIYGMRNNAESVQEMLQGQMQQAYFPVPFEAMQAQINFHELTGPIQIDQATIHAFGGGHHPGGSTLYRVEFGGRSAVFCTDCELDLMLERDPGDRFPLPAGAPRTFPSDLLEFIRGTDVLIVDCQYTDELYAQRINWGHGSLSTVVALAAQSGARRTFLTHHDPESDDDVVAELVESAAQLLSIAQPSVTVHGAREGMTVTVGD